MSDGLSFCGFTAHASVIPLTVISRPGVRLITTNYGGGRVDDCSPDEVSRNEIARCRCG